MTVNISLIVALSILILGHLAAIQSSSVALVSQTATHHVCLRYLATTQNMLIVRAHDNVVLFYNSYATYLIVIVIAFYLV